MTGDDLAALPTRQLADMLLIAFDTDGTLPPDIVWELVGRAVAADRA